MSHYIQLQKQLHAATGDLLLDVDFKVDKGTLLALYGKSGAGKTSILRLLAGLLNADAGRILIAGTCWLDTSRNINLPPQQRRVGMVFQDYALFPNMTIYENLKFALEKKSNGKIITELMQIMELGQLAQRKPATLSGGQQQRVALARALVQRPQLLLLDEPLSALDTEMREHLQTYLLKVHREFGLTTILVSHDHHEIERLADRVLVIENGIISRSGTPPAVFYNSSATGKQQSILNSVIPPAWQQFGESWQANNTTQHTVHQWIIPPAATKTLPILSTPQLCFILRGRALCTLNDQSVMLSTGQSVPVLAGQRVQINNKIPEDLQLLIIS